MRTTVILPDELMRQVKQRAREQDSTVTSFIETALRRVLAEESAKGARRVALPEPVGSGGLLPGVDLDSNAALAEVMDDDAPFEKVRSA